MWIEDYNKFMTDSFSAFKKPLWPLSFLLRPSFAVNVYRVLFLLFCLFVVAAVVIEDDVVLVIII